MTPYLRAFEAYHARGEPHIPWAESLDFHLQHGVVFSSESVFFMARLVPRDRPDLHPQLLPFDDTGECWHVWSAAGDLRDFHSWLWDVDVITYQRRGRSRVHTLPVSKLLPAHTSH